MKKSPLYGWHSSQRAQMVEENGWAIPQSFGSVQKEYTIMQYQAGIIDLCHEARFRIEGENAVSFVNNLLTVDLNPLKVSESLFGYLCNTRGGIIDGITVYIEENYVLLFASAARRQQVGSILTRQAKNLGVHAPEVYDITEEQGHFAVRGTGARRIINQAAFQSNIDLEIGQGAVYNFGPAKSLVIHRENDMIDSYDIIVGAMYIQTIWDKLIDAANATGGAPVGTAAQEIVRVESGIPRVDVEAKTDVTPLEIGQTSRVHFQKRKFPGRRALLHSTSAEFPRSLICLKFSTDVTVRPGAEILFDRLPIGYVTSATVSPKDQRSIALGFVNSVKSEPGTRLQTEGPEGRLLTAEVFRPVIAPRTR